MSKDLDNTVKVNENYQQIARTVFSVLVTPFLGLVTIFFLQQTYHEQKEVKNQQNLILIELGQFKTREQYMQSSLDEFKKDFEKRVEKIEAEIKEIHKK